jgi:hypothetical protein
MLVSKRVGSENLVLSPPLPEGGDTLSVSMQGWEEGRGQDRRSEEQENKRANRQKERQAN